MSPYYLKQIYPNSIGHPFSNLLLLSISVELTPFTILGMIPFYLFCSRNNQDHRATQFILHIWDIHYMFWQLWFNYLINYKTFVNNVIKYVAMFYDTL